MLKVNIKYRDFRTFFFIPVYFIRVHSPGVVGFLTVLQSLRPHSLQQSQPIYAPRTPVLRWSSVATRRCKTPCLLDHKHLRLLIRWFTSLSNKFTWVVEHPPSSSTRSGKSLGRFPTGLKSGDDNSGGRRFDPFSTHEQHFYAKFTFRVGKERLMSTTIS